MRIDNADFTNKRVLIRCDLNVPINNNVIIDDFRIRESIKTIKYVLNTAKKVIILSHLGRVKSKEDMVSLKPVRDVLEELLNEKVAFATYDENINKIIEDNKIILLENTRYFDIDNNKESNCDEELSKYFSSFGDVFINDAFGTCHRKNASNYGISLFLPTYIGFLIEKEIKMLDLIKNNPKKPFIVILGGGKVKDKIKLIDKLIDKTDKMIISGAMSFTFLKSMSIETGNSIVDNDSIEYCKNLLDKYKDKIILPIDYNTSKEFSNESESIIKEYNNLDKDDIGLDIGPRTLDLYEQVLQNCETVFLNGPVGAYELEKYELGTKKLFDILTKIKKTVIVGGGDSASIARKYNYNFTHISTGGGASIEYIEGKIDIGD